MASNQIPLWLTDYMEDNAYMPVKADITRVEPQSITEMLLKYLCLNGSSPATYANFFTSDGDKFFTSDGLELKIAT